jgi:hypothetical protein
MTKEQEQAIFDTALADLPDGTNALGPFYRGYVQGVLAVIKQLRAGGWTPANDQKKESP